MLKSLPRPAQHLIGYAPLQPQHLSRESAFVLGPKTEWRLSRRDLKKQTFIRSGTPPAEVRPTPASCQERSHGRYPSLMDGAEEH